MFKRRGKKAVQEQKNPSDYMSFPLRDRKKTDGSYISPLSYVEKPDGSKDLTLTVKVPNDISPTGYMCVTVPEEKLFTRPYIDSKGNPVEHVNMYHIAKDVYDLKPFAVGRKDQECFLTKIDIPISPSDLRDAIITQARADAAAHSAKFEKREIPEVSQTEDQSENEGISM